MPREVMVEWISELSGQVIGSRSLRFGVDADEFVAKGIARIIDEHPPPRNFLLTDGVVDPGVLAGSQVKMTEEEKKSEQQFLLNQVKNLDAKHEEQAELRRLKDTLEKKRREVSRG